MVAGTGSESDAHSRVGVGGKLEKAPCVLGVPDSPLKMARL